MRAGAWLHYIGSFLSSAAVNMEIVTRLKHLRSSELQVFLALGTGSVQYSISYSIYRVIWRFCYNIPQSPYQMATHPNPQLLRLQRIPAR